MADQYSRNVREMFTFYMQIKVCGEYFDTLGNKVEIWKIKATGSADRDFLVVYSGHG